MLAKHIEYLFHATSLFTSCVKFTIAISTGTSFAKTIIALLINFLRFRNQSQIFLALTYVLATLQNYRTQTFFYQTKCSKESTRPLTYDYYWFAILHIWIICMNEFLFLWKLIDIYTHFQIDKNLPLTRIYITLQHPHLMECANVKTFLLSYILLDILFCVGHLGQYTNLIFLCHICKVTQI